VAPKKPRSTTSKTKRQLDADIRQSLTEQRTKNRPIDTYEAPGLDLVYEVYMDPDKPPGELGRFFVVARYLSDGQQAADKPLPFTSRDQAIAVARSFAQDTVYRTP